MARPTGYLLVLVFSVLALPCVVGAQGPAAGLASSQERLARLLGELSPGADLQVVTPTVFIEVGKLESLGPDAMRVTENGETTTLSLTEIRAVSVRRAHALQGTLWGLGAGVLVGAVSGMMVGSFNCVTPNSCQSAERDGALRWGTIGGTVGAVGGFVIGRNSVYWKPIFP